ncbi:hypothetical protein KKD81_00755 [Patescibacteria group bacterium]|nr:hypothetical protein [Patescibacteria group bacterium]MBU2158895.1 hypothetical protein [Patescibacteria group bacterium]MBU2220449.1 hypothetical protein [Patescibacteria group bacterium]
MNIFKTYKYTWWQVSLFKLSLISFGVAVGAYWYEIFLPHVTLLLGIAVLAGFYIGYVSFRK